MGNRFEREGQQVGDYRLLKGLGKGGFGDVYLGEHVREHTQVAVKVLRTQLTRGEELKEFINEARTMRLKHPHIVSLLDFGIDDDVPFLVMDYAPHGSLRDRHPKGSKLPLTTVVSYVTAIASALQYAHDQHLIHRDVKPENMLIGSNGEILLSDFGIASVAHSSHSLVTGEGVGGTLPYMAPEQIIGKPRPASDQYALAVVVYEWLCGTRPFNGTSFELLAMHREAIPPSLCEQVSTIHPDVEQIVLKALAKDPRERFASVQEFATALEEASKNEASQDTIAPPKTSPSSVLFDPIHPIDSIQQPEEQANNASPAFTKPPVIPTPSFQQKSEEASYASLLEIAPSVPAAITHTVVSPLPQGLPSPKKISKNRTSTSRKIFFSFLIFLVLIIVASTIIGIIHKDGYQTQDAIYSNPIVINGIVYVGSANGNFYSIDARTGTKKWSFQTSYDITSPPTIINDVIYVRTAANLYAINAATGIKKWSFQAGSGISSSPAVVNGVVYVGYYDGSLYAIDATTGAKKWSFQTGDSIRLSSPAIANGVVYVGSDDHYLYAFHLPNAPEQ